MDFIGEILAYQGDGKLCEYLKILRLFPRKMLPTPHPMKKVLSICLFGLGLIFSHFLPGALWAYSSVTVSQDEPVYRQLDLLASYGLVKTMMVGQRPYVRSEIARLIAESLKNYPEFALQYEGVRNISVRESERRLKAKRRVDQILEELKKQYRSELVQQKVFEGKVPMVEGKPLAYVDFNYLYLSEPKGQILPVNNGLGGIDGIVQPLVEQREGRHYQSGSNLAFETLHWARLSPYVALQVQPRFQMQIAKEGLQSETKPYIQQLNGHFTYGKLDLEIGRDAVHYGPSAKGGLLLSSNPRPLDFIKLASVSPFHYPFFFKKFGLNEMSLVVANLGPEQVFQDPWLLIWKISNRRNEYFEFGYTQLLQMGGEGAPPIGFGSGTVEFFDISSTGVRSNRNIVVELIGKVPQARGMQVYVEVDFSNFTSNFSTLFVDYTSYLAGLHMPRLNDDGTLGLRLEYRRLSPLYSRSPVFTDGLTENTLLLGDPLGPDAYGVLLDLLYDLTPKDQMSFSTEYRKRHNNVYAFNGSSVDKISDFGSETRVLYRGGIKHVFNSHVVGRFGFGLDQIHNRDFQGGGNDLDWMVETGIRIYWDPIAGI